MTDENLDQAQMIKETIETAEHLARVALIIESAKKRDHALEQNFLKNKKRAKQEWETLSEQEKQNRRMLGVAYSDAKFKFQSKWVRSERRKLRYKLFRIREGKWQGDPELTALKNWYTKQIKQIDTSWSLKDFTFKWDISAVDPLKVISPFEWDGELLEYQGGGKTCDPAAFTKQEI